LIRQQNLKVLAAEADARWAAKPSFLDSPGRARGQPLPATDAEATEPPEKEGVRNAGGLKYEIQGSNATADETIEGKDVKKMQVPDGIRHHFNEQLQAQPKEKTEKEDPWKQARGGPSEGWQPKAWDGNIAPTKRR